MDRIYCYPNSNVLVNKLNIRDNEKLYEAERKITAFRLQELIKEPVDGNFDLKHLCDIHRYIFQDIYTWAGELRTVDIAKSNLFCKVQYIEEAGKKIFDSLRKDDYLTNLSRDEFIIKIAYYFSEINALHPFREENGRTQREFIRLLALEAGYKLMLSNVTEDEMMEASKESFLCDYSSMEKLFKKAIK